MKKFVIALMLFGLLTSLGGMVLAQGRPFSATLSGANEVSGGDPDGSGSVDLSINPGQGEVCFDMTLENIDPATRAHIHSAPAGVNGGVVVTLFDALATPPVPVTMSNCVPADPAILIEILKNPANYYVNVHNAEHPGGAVRGQLSR